ncbi:MAG: cation:proton antiporter subunit C [Gammaproteobacteria bacterium]|nr:cation:proton antiporter subunit C [Gammaproteobacteria bacterium]
MTPVFLYTLTGLGLFTLGLYALIVHRHLLRKILAINVMGSGVFLVLVALADRTQAALYKVAPDPVPHAMVITGIVVAVSATALGLALMLRVQTETGQADFSDELSDETE